jgi:fatty-acyl-CoA synthase
MDQTLRPFLWRAAKLYPDTEIVSRTTGGIERYDYGAYAGRVAQLAHALDDAGVAEGDRVGTVCWNDHWHFETYFAVPNRGSQLHTINPLLPDHHVQYIVENAQDRLLFANPSLLGTVGSAYEPGSFESVERIVVMGDSTPDTDLPNVTDYESFIEGYPTEYDWPTVGEDQAAGMCYTSGTTGKPKGVEYTHQMLWAHTMATQQPQGIPIEDDDVVMPFVPMFHVNAWGLPFSTTAAGATHVFPGPDPDPSDLADLIENEGVTITAGVPTIWLGMMEYADEHDPDLSSLDTVIVGGSAAPEAMIRWFENRGIELVHAWGMTEMSPIGSVANMRASLRSADFESQVEKKKTQGLMVPGIEFRVDDDGGEDLGELWVRGPWITQEYFERPRANEEEFEDGYLKTGDIVTVDEDGYIRIVDRAKDVIKSGGEWISSVELENAIMAHEDVSEATVIGVPHERWQERPVAFVVPASEASGGSSDGRSDSDGVPAEGVDPADLEDELLDTLRTDFPKWWLPDEVVEIEEIPKTATGKFSKKDLREQYADESLVEGKAPDDAAPAEE